jgi:hypothetical protein
VLVQVQLLDPYKHFWLILLVPVQSLDRYEHSACEIAAKSVFLPKKNLRRMIKYYLVTTDHLEEGLWFRDEKDFIAGMNFVAIQAHASHVTVLAFPL